MRDLVGGIIFLAMGLVFAAFHRGFAHLTDEFWFKVMGVHYGEQIYRIGFLLGGIAFMIFGVLALLQIL